MNIKSELKMMHSYLMRNNFPYNSVSVIHRHQDGFRVFIMKSSKHLLTEHIISYIEESGFSISFVED